MNFEAIKAIYYFEMARTGRTLRMLSVGCGNCDNEVRIAKLLLERGCADWTLVCLDLTAPMLDRGRELATAEGVVDRFEFVAADLANWRTDERFDVVIANQCLHHIFELERVFERISEIMAPQGVFLTSDMIGRNGHMRWPEARELIDRFWDELPKAYRYHRLLRRQENRFQDWDCSITGFEGIRAQDILPSSLAKTLISVVRGNESALAKGALIVVDEARARVRILPLERNS